MASEETEGRPVQIVPIKNEAELFQALAIREIVFIEEQHVPEGIERDAEDATAYHVMAIEGGHAIGTGRIVMLPNVPPGETGKWAQIGRMAVLQSSRKGGTGSKIITALEQEAVRRNVTGILLHAQVASMDFYKKHHYEPSGAIFEEAGMPHTMMSKKLR